MSVVSAVVFRLDSEFATEFNRCLSRRPLFSGLGSIHLM